MMSKTSFILSFIAFVMFASSVYASRDFSDAANNSQQKDVGVWCLLKPRYQTNKLQGFLDFACSKIDCSAIKKGGACFDPDTLESHVNYALDKYYKDSRICNIEIGDVYSVDPSYGNCRYP